MSFFTMHSDRPDESDLQAPWLASLPLEPGYQDAALVIVHQGRAAVPPEGLAQVLRFHADGHGGWIAAARASQGRWGYIDSEGRWRVPPILQKAFSFSADGLARFCQDGRWGFLDLAGRVAIAPTYDNAQPFRHGVCTVQVGKEAWRIIDRHGNAQCSEDFRELGAFGANGLARATPGTETGSAPLHGFVNAAGQWVIAPRFRNARPFGEWQATAASLDGNHHGLIDSAGRWVLAPRYAALDEFNADGLAFFAEHNAWDEGYGYLDVQGQVVVRGGRYLSRQMACGVVAHQPHGRAFLCADGTPLPAPALSFGTDFSSERGFAVVRTAPQGGHLGAGGLAPPLPAWGLLHPDGRWVPAPAQLLEPLTDGDGWLVAPQPDTPLVPFITRDGQMAYINGDGAVVWRAHYDGQQVALLDADGTLLWRSGVQANCWPPRPFFNSPITDHLEGLQTLDGVVPLAHRLLAEAEARCHAGARGLRQAEPAAESAPGADADPDPGARTIRRVVYAGLSESHSGPYAFLAEHLESVVKDAHAALAQRLSARYGAPVSALPGAAAPPPGGNAALGWQVPLTQPPTQPPAGPEGRSGPHALWLTLYAQAGARDGETWWEVWLAASSVHELPAPPAPAGPMAPPRAIPAPAHAHAHSHADAQAENGATSWQSANEANQPAAAARGPWLAFMAAVAAVCVFATPHPLRAWVRHTVRSVLGRPSLG